MLALLALLASALVVGGSLIFGAISLTTLIGTRKEGATVPPAPQA